MIDWETCFEYSALHLCVLIIICFISLDGGGSLGKTKYGFDKKKSKNIFTPSPTHYQLVVLLWVCMK